MKMDKFTENEVCKLKTIPLKYDRYEKNIFGNYIVNIEVFSIIGLDNYRQDRSSTVESKLPRR